MRYQHLFAAGLFILSSQAYAATPVMTAATKYLANVSWRPASILAADFSCHGHKEYAILGTTKKEIVVAIFIHGLGKAPEVLHYSAEARNPATAQLALEDMNFDAKAFEEDIGYLPQGMQSSATCKGLNLSDGEVDSAHIYWDHSASEFSDWVL